MQKQCSHFALENKNWVIVGLDSAYFADEYGMYEKVLSLGTGRGLSSWIFCGRKQPRKRSLFC